MTEMDQYSVIPFAGGGGQPGQTKDPEADTPTEKETQEQPPDKKVLSNHALVVLKKPRSQSLIPVYVRVNMQANGPFRLLWSLVFILPFYQQHIQDDIPAGQGGSEDSETDSDEDDSGDDSSESSQGEDDEAENKEDQPLSLEWPDTWRKQATYLFLLPIVFPLWLTVPDVRKQVCSSCGSQTA